MFFPTAGIEANPLIPPLVAFGISFFTSMGGVSGAFLLLPFQMSVLGYTSPSVSATNQVFNIVAAPGGIYRYMREKRMLWPLAAMLLTGTLPGVFFGALIRLSILHGPAFRIFVALVLLLLGAKLLGELRKRGGRKTPEVWRVSQARLVRRRLEFNFGESRYSLSSPGLFAISLSVGLIGGIYGIGGGAIISPLLVSLYALPVHAISGACLLATFGASLAGLLCYYLMAPYFPGLGVAPDLALGLLFGFGGLAGSYLGARCQKYVTARRIKTGLAFAIFFAAAKCIHDFWASL